MPNWNLKYWLELNNQFNSLTEDLEDRVESITSGRKTPALDEINIGSGRKMSAAVLFFDIRGFTNRTSSSDDNKLKETLYLLNCVIPMVMKIIYDHGGYIEKNTGDGIMAIIGTEDDDIKASNQALSASTVIFYCLNHMINPHLERVNIQKVDARIGIDIGNILITRIGLPSGTSKHKRNFLTVVGPTANIASKIQNMSATNEIWVGDLIKRYAYDWRINYFKEKTPTDWTWNYSSSGNKYKVWQYNAVKLNPE
ncbi:MAG: adenylate/guanylate cyclase domain-containing protein [Aquaticitalea sp.]